MKGFPCSPIRSWRKMTGPRSSLYTIIAQRSSKGENAMRHTKAMRTSAIWMTKSLSLLQGLSLPAGWPPQPVGAEAMPVEVCGVEWFIVCLEKWCLLPDRPLSVETPARGIYRQKPDPNGWGCRNFEVRRGKQSAKLQKFCITPTFLTPFSDSMGCFCVTSSAWQRKQDVAATHSGTSLHFSFFQAPLHCNGAKTRKNEGNNPSGHSPRLFFLTGVASVAD